MVLAIINQQVSVKYLAEAYYNVDTIVKIMIAKRYKP